MTRNFDWLMPSLRIGVGQSLLFVYSLFQQTRKILRKPPAEVWYIAEGNGVIEGEEQVHGDWVKGNAGKVLGDKSQIRRGRRRKTAACHEFTQP